MWLFPGSQNTFKASTGRLLTTAKMVKQHNSLICVFYQYILTTFQWWFKNEMGKWLMSLSSWIDSKGHSQFLGGDVLGCCVRNDIFNYCHWHYDVTGDLERLRRFWMTGTYWQKIQVWNKALVGRNSAKYYSSNNLLLSGIRDVQAQEGGEEEQWTPGTRAGQPLVNP